MVDRTVNYRFPKTSLTAANLVSVGKAIGILRDAIEDDVEYILHQFRSKPRHTFEDFDDLWNELHFSLVHFSCVKRESRENFINGFNSSILDYFHSNSPIIKSGVIFMLYFLYISQPTVWGMNRIRVSSETWNSLFDFYTECINHDTNVDAALIFDKLRDLEAFLFVQQEKLNTHLMQESKEFKRAIRMLDQLQELKLKRIKKEPIDLCLNNGLNEFDALATTYQLAKRDTFCTPQASLAIQRNLKETVNVTEKRPSKLQTVLLSSTLASDETETVRRIKHTCQQMWNTKRRKLELESKKKMTSSLFYE